MTKIIAFDFDNTLTKINLSNNSVNFPLSRYRCELLDNPLFWRFLHESRDTVFCVVSYGYKQLIHQFLIETGLNKYITCVLTPIDFGLIENSDVTKELHGKNVMLRRLQGIFNSDNLLLLDDNSTNNRYARSSGYKTTKYPFLNGLTNANLLDLIK